jgi:hypothetical protein
MERNLLLKEVRDLEFFSPAFLPLRAFKAVTNSPKIPPKLSEETINGYTCYVAIDIGLSNSYSRSRCVDYDKVAKKCNKWKTSVVEVLDKKMTAIYVPDGFKAEDETDVIIYLHGHLGGHPGFTEKQGKPFSPSIKNYLNYSKKPYFNFRPIVNNSGKSVVFVAPTLGAWSNYGQLATKFDDFVEQIIAAINEYIFKERRLKGQFKLGNIIIAAHSGGGAAMQDIGTQPKSQFAKQINAFWGFDSWYNSTSAWNKIAKNTAITINAYWFNSSNLPNPIKGRVTVEKAVKNLDHFTLLPYYFRERVNAL